MAPHHGIDLRHARSCASRRGERCNCSPSYQANVWSARDEKRIRRTFPTLAAARSWRQDAVVALRAGKLRAAAGPTLEEYADAWLDGARAGSVRNRSGDVYKPSVVRGYEQALRLRVLPDLGALSLSELDRPAIQALVDRMLQDGHSASTIRNTLIPLRAMYRRAVSRGDAVSNPTTGLELPSVRGRRDRIADPAEARLLLAAIPDRDRAIWATAFYAGLRLGELRALRWSDVDLDAGIVRVRRSWDPREGEIAPKSRAGLRDVPVPSVLHASLVEHRDLSGRDDGLVFGRSQTRPFEPSSVNLRAKNAWAAAGLPSIGLHEARHTYASLMIAAGVNAKTLSTYMGHSSVTITYDRYGHLMPGNEGEAAALLDAFLDRSITDPRLRPGRFTS